MKNSKNIITSNKQPISDYNNSNINSNIENNHPISTKSQNNPKKITNYYNQIDYLNLNNLNNSEIFNSYYQNQSQNQNQIQNQNLQSGRPPQNQQYINATATANANTNTNGNYNYYDKENLANFGINNFYNSNMDNNNKNNNNSFNKNKENEENTNYGNRIGNGNIYISSNYQDANAITNANTNNNANAKFNQGKIFYQQLQNFPMGIYGQHNLTQNYYQNSNNQNQINSGYQIEHQNNCQQHLIQQLPQQQMNYKNFTANLKNKTMRFKENYIEELLCN